MAKSMRSRCIAGATLGGWVTRSAGTFFCPSRWRRWTGSASWRAPAATRTRCAWRPTARSGRSGAIATGSWATAEVRTALYPAASRRCRCPPPPLRCISQPASQAGRYLISFVSLRRRYERLHEQPRPHGRTRSIAVRAAVRENFEEGRSTEPAQHCGVKEMCGPPVHRGQRANVYRCLPRRITEL